MKINMSFLNNEYEFINKSVESQTFVKINDGYTTQIAALNEIIKYDDCENASIFLTDGEVKYIINKLKKLGLDSHKTDKINVKCIFSAGYEFFDFYDLIDIIYKSARFGYIEALDMMVDKYLELWR